MALFVSIFLVGGALWVRLSSNSTVKYELSLVEQEKDDQEILNFFLDPNAEIPKIEVPLPKSEEALGQQLILDYVELATSGKANQQSLANLADKYVLTIPTLTQADSIVYADLKIVDDSKANLQKYADEITKIHFDYTQRISSKYTGFSLNTLNQELYSFAGTFSLAYKEAATRLRNISVPRTVAQNHLDLVNSYLSSGAAMEAVSKKEADTAKAFAGILALNENLGKESILLNEIQRILNSSGI